MLSKDTAGRYDYPQCGEGIQLRYTLLTTNQYVDSINSSLVNLSPFMTIPEEIQGHNLCGNVEDVSKICDCHVGRISAINLEHVY